MNAKSLVALFVLAISAAAAQADTQVIEVAAPALRDVTPQQAAEMKGLYWMSDGRLMKLWKRGGSIIASLDQEPLAELRAADARTLRSADGRMTVRFTSGHDSSTVDVAVLLRRDGQPTAVVAANHR